MNCLITIKGDGVGRHGVPKHDKTWPLKDYLVDNQVYYIAITKHLGSCTTCSIDVVLKEYLQRRIQIAKFKGCSSNGLIRRAIILERLACKKKEVLTSGLVNEIIWRGGIYSAIEFSRRLSIYERYLAFKLPMGVTVPTNLTQQDSYLLDLVRAEKDFSSDEIKKLLEVASVMLT